MLSKLVPKYMFLISGVGRHKDRLQAFDRALLDAGPLAHNLLAVSSIVPAGCKIISAEKGFSMLTPGEITFCVMARQDINKLNGVASTAVGIARIKDSNHFGYISEYHGNAKNKKLAEEIAKKLAKEMFAVKLAKSKKNFDLDYLSATAASIRQSGKKGEWVSSVSLCIFVL